MTEPKHTSEQTSIEQISPMPWQPSGGACIDDAKGRVVCAGAGGQPAVTCRRDHIIRCVNAHEALLATLAEVLADYDRVATWVERTVSENDPSISARRRLIKRARAAIAAAKG